MTAPLKDLAIQHALSNNWQEAAKVNELLLAENPSDIDSLNRFAFSLIKLGKYRKAKEMYKKVISLDKTNPIAIKNLKKLETISKQKTTASSHGSNGSNNFMNIQDLFIEEAGKTKTIELKNVADRKTLSLLQPGDSVKLVTKRFKVFIQTQENKFIGMLPDSVGARLISLLKGGNEYQTHIKALDDKTVTVFIKETKKAARFRNQPSFPATFSYQNLGSADE